MTVHNHCVTILAVSHFIHGLREVTGNTESAQSQSQASTYDIEKCIGNDEYHGELNL